MLIFGPVHDIKKYRMWIKTASNWRIEQNVVLFLEIFKNRLLTILF